MGAAVEVGQDGVLRRRHDRVAAARLRAAGARRDTDLALPPALLSARLRGGGAGRRVVRGGRRRAGAGVRLPLVARRPPRRLAARACSYSVSNRRAPPLFDRPRVRSLSL